MNKTLRLTDDNWTYGSYHRIHYKKDMLYTFFQYVDIHFVWNVGMGTFSLQDHLVDRLREKGLISDAQAQTYQDVALQFLSQMSAYDEWPIEDIYEKVRQIRRDVLGIEVLEEDWRQRCAGFGTDESMTWGVDQRAKKEALLQEKQVLMFVLCQPEYFPQMMEDIKKAEARGHRVSVLVDRGSDWALSSIDDNDDELQTAIHQGQAALLVYGEEGLLHCRNLQVESIVHAIPYGYHARAMVNQLDGARQCVVYVPKHFDITRWVGTTEKTRLSYWQLWQLWKDHGDGIYEMTVEQLYACYPQYFLNVYENGDSCPEAEENYPIQVCWDSKEGIARPSWSDNGHVGEREISAYFDLRDQAIGQYMSRQPGLTYLSTYFTKDLEQVSIPWDSEGQQTGILVHGVRVAAAESARVIQCDPVMTLRQQLQREWEALRKIQNNRGDEQNDESAVPDCARGLQLYSNFLFFLTPKLAELYNQLRKDRPREQLREKQGHLDYQLYWQDGRRVESFPLYRKSVLAKKRDGKFLMCQYRLGGGQIKIANAHEQEVILGWTAEMVDPAKENAMYHADTDTDTDTRIRIYTPYLSRDEEGEGMFANSYRHLVGENRINLVIIQNKIHCIRRGDVVLPSIGVVISLSQSYGQSILEKLGLTELEEGYFDADDLTLDVMLDGPAGIDPVQWQQVEWAYGGGLSLMTEGRSIYGGETIGEMNERQGTAWLKEEGWLSPLSRQTQESALHVLVKHPRTAIGIAKNGDLFVLVFSGRTRMSTGADYQEMCHIAKALIPDVEAMMNVDGGGSSVLGLAIDGHFMELSYPATSMSSCAGMVRKINTVLCLEV